jgi:hypothetical protein
MQNQARRDFSYNESLNARLIHFLRKEAVEKEAVKKEEAKKEAAERRRRTTRKTSRPGHREAATTMAPLAPSDFPESRVGSSVPFASTICISTRTFYSATSKISSWKNCRRLTWSNSIASLTGYSKQH